ncbi:hypothetical protein [Erwinia sorbitola]|uniref:Uncharacterized protein n=1 Tax=Erwinia sorbitola TaxID=2681984 RepID=A0ABW9RD69_9GAMM|nr:hypothetical protein [Erwinia sorbitola]MTD27942.1 hypothetical protein [Erwinia sorbitola]
MKKEALSHFFAINTCHPPENPYTAPPLTRNNGLQVKVSGGSGSSEPPEKLLKKKLTPKEESVIYATSQQEASALIAPLFNNLSDNLCGHSQD